MNNLKNNVRLIGRLGQDPESRTFESGKNVSTFSLATSEKYTNNKGEKVEDTQWHNIVIWGKSGENAVEFLKKGSHVAISGKLVYRSYEKDEIKKTIAEIQADEFLMLDSKSDIPV